MHHPFWYISVGIGDVHWGYGRFDPWPHAKTGLQLRWLRLEPPHAALTQGAAETRHGLPSLEWARAEHRGPFRKIDGFPWPMIEPPIW